MTMLGAQLDDLDALALRLRSTATEIGDVHTTASGTSGRVVTEVRNSSADALRNITASMDRLRAAVSASASRADATAWSGLNHDRFLDAHRDFDAAILRSEETTTAAFSDFSTAIEQMAAGIEEYTNSLAVSLEQAREASTSMATAVDQQ
ncbi:MAG: hypothetical protein P8N02_10945, partial [Actinomycetota bacterium]|nr:hypothetical protein [Actinomycetota bacterium]